MITKTENEQSASEEQAKSIRPITYIDLERKITEIARAANKKTEEIRKKYSD